MCFSFKNFFSLFFNKFITGDINITMGSPMIVYTDKDGRKKNEVTKIIITEEILWAYGKTVSEGVVRIECELPVEE